MKKIKLTKGRLKDIEIIKFFIPSWCPYINPTEQDMIDFLYLSERGIYRQNVHYTLFNGYNALIQGKRWRGIHIHEMWNAAISEGIITINELKEDLPDEVFIFTCKELNKSISL